MGSFRGSGIEQLLTELGIGPDALLGRGGEASVYALDDVRVVRVPHHRVDLAGIHDREALVEELARGGAPFGLPTVLEVGEIGGVHLRGRAATPGDVCS